MGEIRFERMRPGELESIVGCCPIAWMPMGTIEWHGRHLPVGLDALKAHRLCLRAAKNAGGAVLPPDYFAVNGMAFPWTLKYAPDIVARSVFSTLRRLEKYGFRAAVIVTGHYPVSQVMLLIGVAGAFMAVREMAVAAMPEFFAAGDKSEYFGDHAAKWETSIMMELFPELVDEDELSALEGDTLIELFRKGIQGINPGDEASADVGKIVVGEMVDRLTELAGELLEKNGRRTARRFHARNTARFFRNGIKNLAETVKL